MSEHEKSPIAINQQTIKILNQVSLNLRNTRIAMEKAEIEMINECEGAYNDLGVYQSEVNKLVEYVRQEAKASSIIVQKTIDHINEIVRWIAGEVGSASSANNEKVYRLCRVIKQAAEEDAVHGSRHL